MKKPSLKTVLIVISVVLVTILVVGYVVRGWIRENAIPGYISLTQQGSLTKAAESELQLIQDPFNLIGYRDPQTKNECKLTGARLFSTEVTCQYKVDASTLVSNNSVRGEQLIQTGETIQTLLEQNGWSGSFNETDETTSISEFMTAMAQDIDSVPGSSYQKQVGSYDCTLDTVAASSAPAPLAMASHYTCSKTFKVF